MILSRSHAGKRLGSSERSQLQSNSAWADSRFSALEGFISDYLAGGASAGEGVRLKLQTPLFVSEALLDTAQKQLADLLATAEEVRPAVAWICLSPSSSRCCLLIHVDKALRASGSLLQPLLRQIIAFQCTQWSAYVGAARKSASCCTLVKITSGLIVLSVGDPSPAVKYPIWVLCLYQARQQMS